MWSLSTMDEAPFLAQETFRRSLSCIRCGACMNTCPVFRRSGGYSYGYTVPGPIGSLLGPQRDPQKYGSLPFASSLCGSCSDVCPVKIDLHHELYAFRQELVRKKVVPLYKRIGMAVLAFVLAETVAVPARGKAYALDRAAPAPGCRLWTLERMGTPSRVAAHAATRASANS